MSRTTARSLSAAGRTYVTAVAAVGIPLGAYCAFSVFRHGLPSVYLLAFAALTLISSRLSVKIPSVSSRVSPSEICTFTTVLLFGPEAGAITVALDSILLAWRHRMSAAQTCFNFGNLALSVWISGTLFFLTAGVPPLFGQMAPAGGLVGPLAIFAASYFVINAGLTAIAIAFSTNGRPLLVFRDHFMWLAPGYAAGACIALLLVVPLHQVQFTALALIPPLLLVFYSMLRTSHGRHEDAEVHIKALNCLYLSTVESLATAIDAKDEVTHGHIRRVQIAAMALARAVGIADERTLEAIQAAALLHDIGKMAVPEHILNKPGKLTAAEFEKMKLHAPIGAEILSSIPFPYPVLPIVRHHHENWDGTGYPDRIQGAAIPIGARILAVVDCYDALTSDRPYRRRMTEAAAVAILLERRGTMYDAAIVDTFLAVRHEIMPSGVPSAHPVLRTLEDARARAQHVEAAAVTEPAITTEVLAVASLARAVSGELGIGDVGALTWMVLRQVVPCEAMALFTYDEKYDALTVQYAAGAQAGALRGTRIAMAAGVVGWCAVNRRFVLNADPAIDLGDAATTSVAPLRSSLTMPLLHKGALTGVLALYAAVPDAFTDDHASLLTLLSSSLASSVVAHPNSREWTPSQTESRRSAAGALRLLKR